MGLSTPSPSAPMSAAPALAEGSAGVEPAGEVERTMTAKPNALVPWVQGVARCKVEGIGRARHAKREREGGGWATVACMV